VIYTGILSRKKCKIIDKLQLLLSQHKNKLKKINLVSGRLVFLVPTLEVKKRKGVILTSLLNLKITPKWI